MQEEIDVTLNLDEEAMDRHLKVMTKKLIAFVMNYIDKVEDRIQLMIADSPVK